MKFVIQVCDLENLIKFRIQLCDLNALLFFLLSYYNPTFSLFFFFQDTTPQHCLCSSSSYEICTVLFEGWTFQSFDM